MWFDKLYWLWYTISATTHHHMMFLALPWGREKTISSMLSKVRAYVFICIHILCIIHMHHMCVYIYIYIWYITYTNVSVPGSSPISEYWGWGTPSQLSKKKFVQIPPPIGYSITGRKQYPSTPLEGPGTVDGRNPANHLGCINLVNSGSKLVRSLEKVKTKPPKWYKVKKTVKKNSKHVNTYSPKM